ncbi:MAG: hypothetical protein ACRECN_07505, partial [Methylocella sp.]
MKPNQCRGTRLERKEARHKSGIISHRTYAPKKGLFEARLYFVPFFFSFTDRRSASVKVVVGSVEWSDERTYHPTRNFLGSAS